MYVSIGAPGKKVPLKYIRNKNDFRVQFKKNVSPNTRK